MKTLFKKADRRDPGPRIFEANIATVKTLLGLGGCVIGDDLIQLYGNREALEKACESLKDEYTCFYDTISNFLEFAQEEDATVIIPPEKPTLH